MSSKIEEQVDFVVTCGVGSQKGESCEKLSKEGLVPTISGRIGLVNKEVKLSRFQSPESVTYQPLSSEP